MRMIGVFILTLLICPLTASAQQTSDTTATDSVVCALQRRFNCRDLSPCRDYGQGLHSGLNVSVDLSAFATFGKHVPHRGGFSQRLQATYLAPLSKKLWLAAGGYVQSTQWGGSAYHDGGVYAALGYRFDEHWEAYVYAQKSIANNYHTIWPCGMAWGYLPMSGGFGGYGPMGTDRIGATVRYNVSPSFSIQVSVEKDWMPGNRPAYFDQYNYPLLP